MKREPCCPRCGQPVLPPTVWHDDWTCQDHGGVVPLMPFGKPSAAVALEVAERSPLPVWLPWPLPHGWVVTGVGRAGDQGPQVKATVVACTGPNPLGGAGEMLVVAEEPGVGLGACYAGLAGPDPGPGFGVGLPQAKVHAQGHPTALWVVGSAADDRAVYAGEAGGCWLWLVLFPASAGAFLAERVDLADLRDLGHEVDLLPYGSMSPRLVPRSPT